MLRLFYISFVLFFGAQAGFEDAKESQLPTTLSETSQSLVSKTLWQPSVGEKWQIILNSTISFNISTPLQPKDVNIFEVDLFDTPKTTIQELRGRGVKVICYFSGATSEDWRPDFSLFKEEDKAGCLPRWVGERYLDIRKPGVFEVMKARIRLAGEKGCHAIDPDNIDLYMNNAGLKPPLTKRETVIYFKKLAREAASRQLAIGLKNAQRMLPDVSDDIQFAVNEQCYQTRNCNLYSEFLSPRRQRGGLRNGIKRKKVGKPVFHIEYTEESMKGGPVKRNAGSTDIAGADIRRQCLEGTRLGNLFSTTIKNVNLDGWVQYCDLIVANTKLEKGLIVKGLAKECKGGY